VLSLRLRFFTTRLTEGLTTSEDSSALSVSLESSDTTASAHTDTHAVPLAFTYHSHRPQHSDCTEGTRSAEATKNKHKAQLSQ